MLNTRLYYRISLYTSLILTLGVKKRHAERTDTMSAQLNGRMINWSTDGSNLSVARSIGMSGENRSAIGLFGQAADWSEPRMGSNWNKGGDEVNQGMMVPGEQTNGTVVISLAMDHKSDEKQAINDCIAGDYIFTRYLRSVNRPSYEPQLMQGGIHEPLSLSALNRYLKSTAGINEYSIYSNGYDVIKDWRFMGIQAEGMIDTKEVRALYAKYTAKAKAPAIARDQDRITFMVVKVPQYDVMGRYPPLEGAGGVPRYAVDPNRKYTPRRTMPSSAPGADGLALTANSIFKQHAETFDSVRAKFNIPKPAPPTLESKMAANKANAIMGSLGMDDKRKTDMAAIQKVDFDNLVWQIVPWCGPFEPPLHMLRGDKWVGVKFYVGKFMYYKQGADSSLVESLIQSFNSPITMDRSEMVPEVPDCETQLTVY